MHTWWAMQEKYTLPDDDDDDNDDDNDDDDEKKDKESEKKAEKKKKSQKKKKKTKKSQKKKKKKKASTTSSSSSSSSSAQTFDASFLYRSLVDAATKPQPSLRGMSALQVFVMFAALIIVYFAGKNGGHVDAAPPGGRMPRWVKIQQANERNERNERNQRSKVKDGGGHDKAE